MKATWNIITPEFPPDVGGVADYTSILGPELASQGLSVHIWTMGPKAASPKGVAGETIERLAGRFGLFSLAQLGRRLNTTSRPRILLVQYVAQGFGWKGMNVLFCLWLLLRRFWHGDDVRVMFHEIWMPFVRRPLRWNILALVQRFMAALLLLSCRQAYVSIPAWARLLQKWGGWRVRFEWLPVISNIPADLQPSARDLRVRLTNGDREARLVGHFSMYSLEYRSEIASVLRYLLATRSDVHVVLLGRGGEKFREELLKDHSQWASRVTASGLLPGPEVAAYLQACDLIVYPVPTGISTRRTGVMAALANGVPVVTNAGVLTEPIWNEASGVTVVGSADPKEIAEATNRLLDDPQRLRDLRACVQSFYNRHFAVARTVQILLDQKEPDPISRLGVSINGCSKMRSETGELSESTQSPD